jgi:hypothetical protein
MPEFTEDELLRLRDEHEQWLRGQPGFAGSGVGLASDGTVELKIHSDRMPAAVRNAIVERFANVPLTIEETGRPRLSRPIADPA